MAFKGKWIFNEKTDKFEFLEYPKLAKNDYASKLKPLTSFTEKTRQNFHEDIKPITIDDVKEQVQKLSTHSNASVFKELRDNCGINEFLKYLTIYFDQFLKTVEFILYRRDLIFDSHGMQKNLKSIETERKVSDMLSHKRILLAREFSKIMLGEVWVSRYFNNINKNGLVSYEAFLKFCTFFVYIALHRRGLNTIQYEMDRLFRSSHFTKFPNAEDMPRYSQREKQVLYGVNNPSERCYYFAKSPLIQEILQINRENKELLWIGDLKYLGPSEYLWNLEKPYITSTTQLHLTNTAIGCFGHPKSLYDEHLNADLRKIRKEDFDVKYDTYGLAGRAKIVIPKGKVSLQGNPKTVPGMKIRQKEKYKTCYYKNGSLE